MPTLDSLQARHVGLAGKADGQNSRNPHPSPCVQVSPLPSGPSKAPASAVIWVLRLVALLCNLSGFAFAVTPCRQHRLSVTIPPTFFERGFCCTCTFCHGFRDMMPRYAPVPDWKGCARHLLPRCYGGPCRRGPSGDMHQVCLVVVTVMRHVSVEVTSCTGDTTKCLDQLRKPGHVCHLR